MDDEFQTSLFDDTRTPLLDFTQTPVLDNTQTPLLHDTQSPSIDDTRNWEFADDGKLFLSTDDGDVVRIESEVAGFPHEGSLSSGLYSSTTGLSKSPCPIELTPLAKPWEPLHLERCQSSQHHLVAPFQQPHLEALVHLQWHTVTTSFIWLTLSTKAGLPKDLQNILQHSNAPSARSALLVLIIFGLICELTPTSAPSFAKGI